MKIIDCEQGSSKWFTARCGVVTASEIDALVTPSFAPRKGQGVETYFYRKLAEKVMGYSQESLNTFNMSQGQIVEKIARPWYAFDQGVKVDTVGFCLSDDRRCGASPDGLVGEDGGLEIKAPTPPVHLSYLFAGKVPDDYLPQVHFSLWVTKRKWWDFVSYNTDLPPLVVRVYPDEAICAALESVLAGFLARLDAAHARIMEMAGKGKETP